jgi:hypothetical protein
MKRSATIFVVVMIALLCVDRSSEAQVRRRLPAAAPPSAPAPKPTENDPLRTLVWDSAVEAGVNVRYWSVLAERAEAVEIKNRNWSIFTGVFCFAFPFIARQYFTGRFLSCVAVATEIASVLVFAWSMTLMLDSSATHSTLATIQSRWAVLKPELDELFKIAHTLPHEELQLRFDALKKAKQGIVPIEPEGKDEQLMHLSWVQEMHQRNVDPAWVAQVEKSRDVLKIQTN